MRVICLLVSVLLGGCAGYQRQSPPCFTSVAILSTEPDHPWCASGVFIGDGLLLTASHVTEQVGQQVNVDGWMHQCELIRGGGAVSISGDPRKTFPVYVRDWAVLRLDGSASNAVPRAASIPQPGDTVWLQGFPGGNRVELSGIVQSHSSFGSSVFVPRELLVVRGDRDIGALQGASGGAVLNAHGELVGILVGEMRTSTGRKFWVVRSTHDLFT